MCRNPCPAKSGNNPSSRWGVFVIGRGLDTYDNQSKAESFSMNTDYSGFGLGFRQSMLDSGEGQLTRRLAQIMGIVFAAAIVAVCLIAHPATAGASSFGDPMADGTKYCPPTLTSGYGLNPSLQRSCPGQSPLNCVSGLVKAGVLAVGWPTASRCGSSSIRNNGVFTCDFAGGDCYPSQCPTDMAIGLGAFGLLENAMSNGEIAIPVTSKAVPPADLALAMANIFIGFEVRSTYLKLSLAADTNVKSTCGEMSQDRYDDLKDSIRSNSKFKLTISLTRGFSFGKGYFGQKWDQAAKGDEVKSMASPLAVAIAQAYAARTRSKNVSFAWRGVKSKKRSNGSVGVSTSFSPGGVSVGTTITLGP